MYITIKIEVRKGIIHSVNVHRWRRNNSKIRLLLVTTQIRSQWWSSHDTKKRHKGNG